MNERHLYRGLNKFEGSIDEEGNLYDERHWYIGRIEGDAVYDNCNIKQGRIDESGKLWDINHTYVGEAHGNNFIGPTYQSTGMVRGDSFNAGNGCEYGALMMLKERSGRYSGGKTYNDYNFPNNDDEEDDEDEYEDDEEESGDYDDSGISFDAPPPSRRRSGRNADDVRSSGDDSVPGCFGCLFVVLFVIGIFLVLRMYSGVPFSEW